MGKVALNGLVLGRSLRRYGHWRCWTKPTVDSFSKIAFNRHYAMDQRLISSSRSNVGLQCCSQSSRLIFGRQLRNANSSATGSNHLQPDNLTELDYEHLADETLESLWEVFDKLSDDLKSKIDRDFDVSYSQGVLTVQLGGGRGTYVINKQTPNKQIWFSSPFSGPKRYDMVRGRWIYLHDGVALHDLLTKEIKRVFESSRMDFTKCAHG